MVTSSGYDELMNYDASMNNDRLMDYDDWAFAAMSYTDRSAT
jgi:hypothetical protein